MMTEADFIVDELKQAFDGDPWHGDSLMDILRGVTARAASHRPLSAAHTIWELVLHITAWRREVASRMRGNPAGEPPAVGWPAAPSGEGAAEAAWRGALEDLAATQRELLDAVRALDPAKLHAPVKDARDQHMGTGKSHAAMLHGLAQHDAYHTGQIALLKKDSGLRV